MLSRDKSPAISGVKFCIYLDQWISVVVVVTEFYLRLRLGMTGNKFLERLKQMVDSDPADVVSDNHEFTFSVYVLVFFLFPPDHSFRLFWSN